MLISVILLSMKVKKIKNQIIVFANHHSGMITSEMAKANNIHNATLAYWVKKGLLEKTGRGVFVFADAFEDEFVKYQSIYKKGIYSLQSALFLLGMTDRTPSRFSMTFSSHYNITTPKQMGILCNQVNNDFYEIGKKRLKTPLGNDVFAYNAERTLCDILKKTNNVDIETVTTAFKMYVNNKEKDLNLLSEYSKIFHVEKKVRTYMEVLL